jgi:hypothetical protein
LALSCFGIDCRGGVGFGQASSKTALIKNNLLPMFVALNSVGFILIKIVIAIILSREYVSHVIAQCPGRVASTAGAFLLSHQQNQVYPPQQSWPLPASTLDVRTGTDFFLKIFRCFVTSPEISDYARPSITNKPFPHRDDNYCLATLTTQ